MTGLKQNAAALFAFTAFLLPACSSLPPLPPPKKMAASPAPAAHDRIDDHAFGLKGALSQGGYAIGRAPAGTASLTLDGKPVMMDDIGRFAIGFGRDAAPKAQLVATLANGAKVTARLAIIQRSYDVQRIDSLPPTPSNDPEWLKRRAAERARIDAAKAQRNVSDGWRQSWTWPLKGRISGIYGSQRVLGGVPQNPHYAVDIAAPDGTPVYAPADGVVALAGPPQFSLEGNLVIIDHGMGVDSVYLHLSSIEVKPGERVLQGQRIGSVGHSGRATGPHLHWGVDWQDQRLDPALLAGPMTGIAPAQP